VIALHEDLRRGIWIGTDLGDVHYWRDGKIIDYGVEDGLHTGNASAITEGRLGRIWIGFAGNRLAVFHGNRFEHVGEERGFTTPLISSLYVDSRGDLRVGTADQGLFRLGGDRFVRQVEADACRT